jgi:hypothetical protein
MRSESCGDTKKGILLQMLISIQDGSSAPSQAVIEVSLGGNGSVANRKYPDPCPYTWTCKTPLAFNLPTYLAQNEPLGTEMVHFSFLGNTGYLVFYYLTDEKKRVNVFRLFEPFAFGGYWNGDGDSEIYRSGSNRMHPGLGSWEQLTWARPFVGD